MESEVKAIMKHFLTRLRNMSKWGGAHSELKRVIKSLSTYLQQDKKGKKYINKAIKSLVNLGFLIIKPSTGEFHVSLNPRKQQGIYEFLQKP